VVIRAGLLCRGQESPLIVQEQCLAELPFVTPVHIHPVLLKRLATLSHMVKTNKTTGVDVCYSLCTLCVTFSAELNCLYKQQPVKISDFRYLISCIYVWNIECVRTVFLSYNQFYYERVNTPSTRQCITYTCLFTRRTWRVSLFMQATKGHCFSVCICLLKSRHFLVKWLSAAVSAI